MCVPPPIHAIPHDLAANSATSQGSSDAFYCAEPWFKTLFISAPEGREECRWAESFPRESPRFVSGIFAPSTEATQTDSKPLFGLFRGLRSVSPFDRFGGIAAVSKV